MIFEQASYAQIEAAQIFGGAVMAGFVAAAVFRRQARRLQMLVAGLYVVGVVGFTVCGLL